jgi:acyl-CoA synthetase (AMP-forming)/AMP-acid ligase II
MKEQGSVLENWLQSPRTDRGVHVAEPDGNWTYHSYQELAGRVRGTAELLRYNRIAAKSTVLVLFSQPDDFIAGFFGVLAAGCTPSPVATPLTFGSAARYSEHLRTLARVSGCAAVLTENRLQPLARGAFAGNTPAVIVAGGTLASDRDSSFTAFPDRVLLQFTSGSSGFPKGVPLTGDNLCANLTALRRWLRVTPDEIHVEWMPHYHDFGLISMLENVVFQRKLWVMTPYEFICDPGRWLRCISDEHAEIAAAPNFGYAHIARTVSPESLAGADFSNWRVALLGAERIDPTAVAEFTRLVEPFGFRPAALVAAYGMAEATLVVTGAAPGKGSIVRRVESAALRFGEPVRLGPAVPLGSDLPGDGIWLTGCGAPVDGVAAEIVDENGDSLPDGCVGEIRIRGASVVSGYLGVNSDRFGPSGFRTGDTGILADGELFVVGRIGDSMKVHGKAVHAEDLEFEIAAELGMTQDRVAVLLGTHDAVDLAVALIPVEMDDAQAGRVVTLMRARTAESVATAVLRCRAAAIERTSSGKPRRRVMWKAIAAGELPGELTHTTWHDITSASAPWQTDPLIVR